MRWAGRAFALLAMLFAASCDNRDQSAAANEPATAIGVGAATVKGHVFFRGEPPAAQSIPASSCHTGAFSIEVTPVRVDDQGRLANVVVFVKGVQGGEPGATEPVVLDQVNCVYVPHVVALRVGQTLRVKSSDATLHNVHGLPSKNPAFNVGMTAVGASEDRTFTSPESFSVRCDVHPWMSASINIFAHSFFAITKDDGSFEIPKVPAGEYTLVYRHDFLGDVESKVVVKDGETVVADATFERGAK